MLLLITTYLPICTYSKTAFLIGKTFLKYMIFFFLFSLMNRNSLLDKKHTLSQGTSEANERNGNEMTVFLVGLW